MRNQFEENQNAFCDPVQVTQVKPVIKPIISILDSWNETFFERISQNETLFLQWKHGYANIYNSKKFKMIYKFSFVIMIYHFQTELFIMFNFKLMPRMLIWYQHWMQ